MQCTQRARNSQCMYNNLHAATRDLHAEFECLLSVVGGGATVASLAAL